MTITERAINKLYTSLEDLQLYDPEDPGYLLHQFCNNNCINNNWRGAAPYHIPTPQWWHEQAISLIARAFREKWKYPTLAEVALKHIKTTPSCGYDVTRSLPTTSPLKNAKAFIFATLAILFSCCFTWLHP